MEGKEKSMGNYREKEEKRKRRGGTDGGGMKGNGENVGEDKRKEERNDGGKERETAEVHAVLTGDYSSTYVRVLERISQYENESYRISPRKLPTFYEKVTEFLK